MQISDKTPFQKFLSANTVSSRQEANIVAFQGINKNYYINLENKDKFCNFLKIKVKEQDSHNYLFRFSKNTPTRVRFDVDIVVKEEDTPASDFPTFLYTKQQAIKTVGHLLETIKNKIKNISPDFLNTCILEKNIRVVEGKIKHGFHIEFINLFMPNYEIKTIVELTNAKLVNVFDAEINRGGFKPDNNFIKNDNWFVYGGSKENRGEFFKASIFLNSKLQEIKTKNYTYPDLVKLFWLFPTCDQKVHFINDFMDNIQHDTEISDDVDIPDCEDKQVWVSTLLDGLHQKRVEQSKSWYIIISAVKNYTITEKLDMEEMYQMMKIWSRRTTIDNYSEISFDNAWEKYDRDVCIKSLIKFWYIDNKNFSLITNGTDRAIAELIFREYEGKIFLLDEITGYTYNEEKRIWEKGKYYDVFHYCYKYLKEVVKDGYKTLETKIKLSKKEMEMLKSKLNKTSEKIDGSRNIKGIIVRLLEFCKDINFEDKLNKKRDLFPIKGGKVINLLTGEVQSRKQDDFFTFESVVDYVKPTERAENYFLDIADDRPALSFYIQCLFLYCLTGYTFHKSFYQLIGEKGNNGKSLFVSMLKKILGNLSCTGHKSVIVGNGEDKLGSCPEKLKMKNKRIIVFSETKQKDFLNCSSVKSLTGDDDVSFRGHWKEDEEFPITGKILIITNHPLKWHGEDKAVKNRARFIPFDNEFEVDENFKDKLLSNEDGLLSEIFSLCVNNGKEMIKNKQMPECKEVVLLTEQILSDLDTVGNFLREESYIKSTENNLKVSSSTLYENYKNYCRLNQQDFLSDKKFSEKMIYLGFEKKKTRTDFGVIMCYTNILKTT